MPKCTDGFRYTCITFHFRLEQLKPTMIAVRPVILAVIFCAIASLDGKLLWPRPSITCLDRARHYIHYHPVDACPAGQFDCTGTGNGNGTSCISAALVCNNIVNCPTGGLDENTAMICGKPK